MPGFIGPDSDSVAFAGPSQDAALADHHEQIKQATKADPGFWSNFGRNFERSLQDKLMAFKQLTSSGDFSNIDPVTGGRLGPSSAPPSPQELAQYHQQLQQQQSQIQQQRAQGPQPSGVLGNAGAILGSGAPNMALSSAAPSSIPAQMAAGALGGLTDPTSTQNPSSLGNAATDAVTQGAFAGVGKALGSLGLTKMVSDRYSALVDYLRAHGIPVDLAQATGSKFAQTLKNLTRDSPFTGNPSSDVVDKFTKSVMQRTGQLGAETADPDTLTTIFNRIGSQYRTVAANTQALLTPNHLQSLVGLMRDVEQNVADPNARNAIKGRIVNILKAARRQSVDIGDRAPGEPPVNVTPDIVQGGVPATRGGPVVPHQGNTQVGPQVLPFGTGPTPGPAPAQGIPYLTGNQWMNIKQWNDKWVLGKDPNLRDAAGEIQKILNEALRDSSDSQYTNLLDQSNQQYRAALQATRAAGPDGKITPNSYWNAIGPRGPNWRQAKTTLKGDQDVAELARAGAAVLKEGSPNSGTPMRLLPYMLAGAAGGGYEGYEHGGAYGGLAGAATGMAAPSFLARTLGPQLAREIVFNPKVARWFENTAVSKPTRDLLQKAGIKAGGVLGAGEDSGK